MYAGAALLGVVEALTPTGPGFSMIPPAIALVLSPLVILLSGRVPRSALSILGLVGVVLIADAVASTGGTGDGAVLYMWPVVWASWFFGRRVLVATLVCVAVAHAVTLRSMPPGVGYLDRWIDVVAAVTVVGVVVRVLAEHNQRLVSALVSEARRDALTGLLNRRGFDERASIELARARRQGWTVAVASFDLDHFKHVNDEYGHHVGDQVLSQFSEVLLKEARGIDVVARMGGEEFTVLLAPCDLFDSYAFAERIRTTIATIDPPITTSVGLACTSAPATIEELLLEADHALYNAKRAGRDQTMTATAASPPIG
jgi:diguanylate cyclase (GGDEF)-like protein